MKYADFEYIFDNYIAPMEYADMSFDNVGLLLGRRDKSISSLLCVLDISMDVVHEAIDNNIDMIVCHHPLIFGTMDRINSGDILGQKILKLASNDISVYAAHTNLDFVNGGINDYMAQLLGLDSIVPLDSSIKPYGRYELANLGLGRVGELEDIFFVDDYASLIKERLGTDKVTIIGDKYATINKVVVINGSGGGSTQYIDDMLRVGANCLVTSEVKHHVAMYAYDNGVNIISASHFDLEYPYMQYLSDRLKYVIMNTGLDCNCYISNCERDRMLFRN